MNRKRIEFWKSAFLVFLAITVAAGGASLAWIHKINEGFALASRQADVFLAMAGGDIRETENKETIEGWVELSRWRLIDIGETEEEYLEWLSLMGLSEHAYNIRSAFTYLLIRDSGKLTEALQSEESARRFATELDEKWQDRSSHVRGVVWHTAPPYGLALLLFLYVALRKDRKYRKKVRKYWQ